jgi:hypothetical protein
MFRGERPAVTAVLEVEWVLRGAYGYCVAEAARALRAFGGLPTVTVEDGALVPMSSTWPRTRWTLHTPYTRGDRVSLRELGQVGVSGIEL